MRKIGYLFLALFVVFLIFTLTAVGSYISAKTSPHYYSGINEFIILFFAFLDLIFLIIFLIIYFKKE